MTQLFEGEGARLEARENRLLASGDVDFSVAPPLAAAGHQWLEQRPAQSTVSIDMSGVDQVSSAALSVVLEWLRDAHRSGVKVQEVALSKPLKRLTELAGLDALLPGSEAASDQEKASDKTQASDPAP
ncbi:STAS domain-containing protein [Pistricoccus aurantiacus]|uniref:STAS domain-containing protein n=1 Tax=Pistricoccus aurantiacus TaxID=1883414 RepID=UPI00363F95C5